MRRYQAYLSAIRVSEYLLYVHAIQTRDSAGSEFYMGEAERELSDLAELMGYRVVRDKQPELVTDKDREVY